MSTVLITPTSSGSGLIRDLVTAPVSNGGEGSNVKRHQLNPEMPDHISRVLYLYSHPYNCLISYLKRGFAKPLEIFSSPELQSEFEGIMAGNKNGMGFYDYLNRGKDYAGIENHFKSYFDYEKRTYDIMFAKYECLPEIIEQVLDWFQLSEAEKQRCLKEFNFTKRKSDWTTENEDVKNALERILGNHALFTSNLPDVTIKLKYTE
jgi:hypothetical protein